MLAFVLFAFTQILCKNNTQYFIACFYHLFARSAGVLMGQGLWLVALCCATVREPLSWMCKAHSRAPHSVQIKHSSSWPNYRCSVAPINQSIQQSVSLY